MTTTTTTKRHKPSGPKLVTAPPKSALPDDPRVAVGKRTGKAGRPELGFPHRYPLPHTKAQMIAWRSAFERARATKLASDISEHAAVLSAEGVDEETIARRIKIFERDVNKLSFGDWMRNVLDVASGRLIGAAT